MLPKIFIYFSALTDYMSDDIVIKEKVYIDTDYIVNKLLHAHSLEEFDYYLTIWERKVGIKN